MSRLRFYLRWWRWFWSAPSAIKTYIAFGQPDEASAEFRAATRRWWAREPKP